MFGLLLLNDAVPQRAGNDTVSHTVRDDVDVVGSQLRQLTEELLEDRLRELGSLLIPPVSQCAACRRPAVEKCQSRELQIVCQLSCPQCRLGKSRVVAMDKEQ